MASPASLSLADRLHRLFRRLGFDIVRYNVPKLPAGKPPHQPSKEDYRLIAARQQEQRMRLIEQHRITLLLDVGANVGQFAHQLRTAGYAGRIVSFEPLADAFAELVHNAQADPGWECKHLALGDSNTRAAINVSWNSFSSSLLPMDERHLMAAPDSIYLGKEGVEVVTLDSISPQLIEPEDRVYLKLDVQGYELKVLRGASDTLPRVQLIEAELSLTPLYEGGSTLCEVVNHLNSAGFRLVGLHEGLIDPHTGELLQADGIFLRDI